MVRTHVYAFLLVAIGCLMWLTPFFLPIRAVEGQNPGISRYGYPINLYGDYYHYLYFLKSGLEGRLNFDNVYTDTPQPFQFLEPHYNLVGFIARPFHVTNVDLFTILRVITPCILIVFVVWLIRLTVKPRWGQLLALVAFIFSTSMWWPGRETPDVASSMFQIADKILTLPPHYFIATALTIVLLIHSTRLKPTVASHLWGMFLIVNLGIMHPFVGLFTYSYMVIASFIEMGIKKKFSRLTVAHLISMGLTLLPCLVYYQYMLSFVWKSRVLSNNAGAGWLPLGSYLMAIGPVFFFALPAIVFPQTWRKPIHLRLMIWAFVPILFFILAAAGLPANQLRLFQTYQDVPLAILTAISVAFYVQKLPEDWPAVAAFFCMAAFIGYAWVPYMTTFRGITSPNLLYFRWEYDIHTSQGVFAYFNTFAPNRAVVVAPDPISAYLPSFTHMMVLIGQEGCNPNYYVNKREIDRLYNGEFTREDMIRFLITYRVRYLLFGLESGLYDDSPYASFPFLKDVYRDERATIVEVTNSL